MDPVEPPTPPDRGEQPDHSTLRVRAVMKAYVNAPVETRHLAARQADEEFLRQNPLPSQDDSATPASGERPTSVVPRPTGTLEERNAWADQVVEKAVENMRKLPKNFIPKY